MKSENKAKPLELGMTSGVPHYAASTSALSDAMKLGLINQPPTGMAGGVPHYAASTSALSDAMKLGLINQPPTGMAGGVPHYAASTSALSDAMKLGLINQPPSGMTSGVPHYAASTGVLSDAVKLGLINQPPTGMAGGVPHYAASTGALSGAIEPPVPSNFRTARSSSAAKAIGSAKEIGLLVRVARQKMKLNQQTFADLAGVGRRFVSELEGGKPTLEFDKVLKACAAAGIDLLASIRATT